MDWHVRVLLFVQVVVMKAMCHSIRTHWNARCSTTCSTNNVIDSLIAEQAAMRSIVSQNKECLLTGRNHHDRRQHNPWGHSQH
jgi:hypothetical protein